jgi:hypothetical protein
MRPADAPGPTQSRLGRTRRPARTRPVPAPAGRWSRLRSPSRTRSSDWTNDRFCVRIRYQWTNDRDSQHAAGRRGQPCAWPSAPADGGSEDAMSTSPRGGPDRTRCRVAPSALALLESARDGLAAGQSETSAASRYVAAHLAALRAAAAIVAARPEPGTTGRRRRPRSVWELLTRAEPALSEWAAFFAAGAAKRAAAEAGLSRAVSLLEADDLIRDAGTFVTLAENVLGISVGWPLPIRTAG